MSRRGYLLIAVVLVIVSIGAVAFAAGTSPKSVGKTSAAGSGDQAPALAAAGWINTAPLTAADLKGKVVLYDFWTYSCVNCVRTIPYIRSWYDAYKGDGLVIVGVHSPEFQFEKVHSNVQAAVKRLGVNYPVALDDNMRIWTAFGNQYWPADYLYGRDGRQASVHFGEGDYTQTENEIRKLLGVPAGAPRATVGHAMGGSDGTANITAETYNGSDRGGQAFVSSQPLVPGTTNFTAPAASMMNPGDHALSGRWTVAPEYVQSAAPGASLVLRYYAGGANLVMATADGKPIDVQVKVDDRAPTTVRVGSSDLYNLVQDRTEGEHTLTLTPAAPGLQAYAFTFGG